MSDNEKSENQKPESQQTEKEVQDTPKEGERHFSIQKIYVKDISFETPHSPVIFTEAWKPDVNMQMGNTAKALGDGVHEVTLSLTVTTKLGEKTAYLAEVQQAGIFKISGFDKKALSAMMGSYCPNILFPFAREAVCDLVTRGGFPQLLLSPVNFDALYMEYLQRSAKQAEDNESKH
jgi:preprotein translocase subunit SecB